MSEIYIDENKLTEISEKHRPEVVNSILCTMKLIGDTFSSELISGCEIENYDESVILNWKWCSLHISSDIPLEYAVQVYNHFRPAPYMFILTMYNTFEEATNALVEALGRDVA